MQWSDILYRVTLYNIFLTYDHMMSEKISLKSNWNSWYLAGEWIGNGDNHLIKDQNPYTGEVIAEVPSATAEDVDRAFDVAARVYTI
jgi:hypothetical protein